MLFYVMVPSYQVLSDLYFLMFDCFAYHMKLMLFLKLMMLTNYFFLYQHSTCYSVMIMYSENDCQEWHDEDYNFQPTI